MPERARNLWTLTFSPVVWAAHFLIAYGTTAVICAKGGDPLAARWTIAAASVVALVLIGIVALRSWRQWDFAEDHAHVHDRPTHEHRSQFLGHAGVLLSIVSAIGVIYVSLPAAFIESCL